MEIDTNISNNPLVNTRHFITRASIINHDTIQGSKYSTWGGKGKRAEIIYQDYDMKLLDFKKSVFQMTRLPNNRSPG